MSEPIVPDFTPVTPEEFSGHMHDCPDCGPGPIEGWCPAGKMLWEKLLAQCRALMERRSRAQAWDLIRAGWRFEVPDSDDPEVMSWSWRAPPRRKGSAGRRYPSTNRAWRAWKRSIGEDPGEQG